MFIRSLTLVAILAARLTCYSQTSEHPGVKLYREGNYAAARVALSAAVKDKAYQKDAALWNTLGLAFVSEGNFKEARKSFEKATSITPAVAAYHANLAYVHLTLRQTKKARESADKALAIDPRNATSVFTRGAAFYWDGKLDEAEVDALQAIRLDERNASAYLLESQVLIARLAKNLARSSLAKELPTIEKAKDILESGLSKCTGNGCDELKSEFEGLTAFVAYARRREANKLLTQPPGPPPPPEPGVTPIKIVSKPKPVYTEKARASNTQGTIQIAILFGANGLIQHMIMLKRLGNGLDERAAAAARNIQFEPMQVDGKPVPVVKVVEYSFSIY